MSEDEEALASELSLSGARAWRKLRHVLISQLKVPLESEGESKDLPITVIINLRTDPDGDVRRRAYQAEMEAWEKLSEPLAACLNGVKGSVITLSERRGREEALHKALDQARISRDTLEVMMGAMQKSFPDFRRYFKSKASRLGVEKLPWWDLMAPLGKADKRYSYDESRELILDHFGQFSERLAGLAERRGDMQAAFAYMRTARGIDPTNLAILDRLGYFAEKTEHFADALSARKRAVEIDPSSPRLAANLVDYHLVCLCIHSARPIYTRVERKPHCLAGHPGVCFRLLYLFWRKLPALRPA